MERLKGDRAGQYSIRTNDQWRICFVWTRGDALDVEIVHGKRAVTADTTLRLARYFGTSEAFWMGLQADYDLEEAPANVSVTVWIVRCVTARPEFNRLSA